MVFLGGGVISHERGITAGHEQNTKAKVVRVEPASIVQHNVSSFWCGLQRRTPLKPVQDLYRGNGSSEQGSAYECPGQCSYQGGLVNNGEGFQSTVVMRASSTEGFRDVQDF